MSKRRIISAFLVSLMILLLFAGCTSETDSDIAGDSQSAGEATVSDDSGDAENGSAKAKDVPAAVKYVSKDYMLTTLTDSDCTITEDETGLNFYTANSAINISITPGIQNLTGIAACMQSSIPTYFQDGQAKEISDGYLFGNRAKLFLFDCTVNGTPCYGLMSMSIVNQTLYTMSMLINDQTTAEEFELMKQIVSCMIVLQPASVDSAARQATYVDPYPEYTTYYSDEDFYDISTWYYMPYECYSWIQIDYSTWTDTTLFEPDWNYYSEDDTYWDWSWDSENDWYFYDSYAEYYAEDAYETQTDYYEDFDYDSYDVWEEQPDYGVFESSDSDGSAAYVESGDGGGSSGDDGGSYDENGTWYETGDAWEDGSYANNGDG